MSTRWVACLAGILLLSGPVDSSAQIGRNRDVEALRQARWVSVWLGSIADDVERDGLVWRSLHDAVGGQLKRNGVPSLPEPASISDFAFWEGIMLNVHVNTLKVGDSYAYCIRTEVVVLTGTVLENGFPPGEVPVWTRERLGTVPASDLSDIQKSVLEHVDAFSRDFLAANARQLG